MDCKGIVCCATTRAPIFVSVRRRRRSVTRCLHATYVATEHQIDQTAKNSAAATHVRIRPVTGPANTHQSTAHHTHVCQKQLEGALGETKPARQMPAANSTAHIAAQRTMAPTTTKEGGGERPANQGAAGGAGSPRERPPPPPGLQPPATESQRGPPTRGPPPTITSPTQRRTTRRPLPRTTTACQAMNGCCVS